MTSLVLGATYAGSGASAVNCSAARAEGIADAMLMTAITKANAAERQSLFKGVHVLMGPCGIDRVTLSLRDIELSNFALINLRLATTCVTVLPDSLIIDYIKKSHRCWDWVSAPDR
jgi:hypothetical protein